MLHGDHETIFKDKIDLMYVLKVKLVKTKTWLVIGI